MDKTGPGWPSCRGTCIRQGPRSPLAGPAPPAGRPSTATSPAPAWATGAPCTSPRCPLAQSSGRV
eukprot:14742495-Alexandrium_andersonii.AAC.1